MRPQIEWQRKSAGEQCSSRRCAIAKEVALNSPHALEQITMLRQERYCPADRRADPTDVAVSLEYGFKTMRFFPAGSMPTSYLKGPFDDTHYMAIGGVNPQNILQFFDASYLSVGLASSLMPRMPWLPTTGRPARPWPAWCRARRGCCAMCMITA